MNFVIAAECMAPAAVAIGTPAATAVATVALAAALVVASAAATTDARFRGVVAGHVMCVSALVGSSRLSTLVSTSVGLR